MTSKLPYPRTADAPEIFSWARNLIQALSRMNLDQKPLFLPSGLMCIFPGDDAGDPPTGWLWCDGAVLDRTQYAAIFSIIDTDFNTGGEAGTEFRLPDYTSSVGGVTKRWIIRV